MASLSAEQRKVIAAIFAGAARGHKDGSPVTLKEIKAALQTGRVESNFTNSAKMTDHDSQGWRQERASLYKDPTNLTNSVARFFEETGAVKGKYGTAGALAAAVQRPAAQYRGRYAEVSDEADALLRQFGGGKQPKGGSGGLSTRLSGGSPGRPAVPGSTTKVTATSGGQPIALPDTGATGLSAVLLAGLGQRQPAQLSAGSIQAPSFSAEKYGGGSIQPVGLGAAAPSSGVAGQLAALANTGSTDLPALANEASSASATARVPGLPAVKATKGTPVRAPAKSSSSKAAGGAKVLQGRKPQELRELFYDPLGGVKHGQKIAAIGGHGGHVHVAAGPKQVVAIGKLAQKMGLNVGENPQFGGVAPVHTDGSYHYKQQAIDVSGSAATMAAFYKRVQSIYGVR